MNIYLLTQTKTRGYDTYDSMVVIAPSREEAVKIHPCGNEAWGGNRPWCPSPDDVTAEFIGVANTHKQGIVLSSFNAG